VAAFARAESDPFDGLMSPVVPPLGTLKVIQGKVGISGADPIPAVRANEGVERVACCSGSDERTA